MASQFGFYRCTDTCNYPQKLHFAYLPVFAIIIRPSLASTGYQVFTLNKFKIAQLKLSLHLFCPLMLNLLHSLIGQDSALDKRLFKINTLISFLAIVSVTFRFFKSLYPLCTVLNFEVEIDKF